MLHAFITDSSAKMQWSVYVSTLTLNTSRTMTFYSTADTCWIKTQSNYEEFYKLTLPAYTKSHSELILPAFLYFLYFLVFTISRFICNVFFVFLLLVYLDCHCYMFPCLDHVFWFEFWRTWMVLLFIVFQPIFGNDFDRMFSLVIL